MSLSLLARARVPVPCHTTLKAVLKAHKARQRKAGRIGGHILRRADGAPTAERMFAARWDEIMAQADLAELQRRDLRRTAMVRLAESGCEIPQITAITGHSVSSANSILETYMPRTYPMAQAAIKKLEDYTKNRDEK